MTIDADVNRIAKRFGVDAGLIQAVVKAEGNIVKAVQCSIPSVTTREEALEVTCRSAAHAMSDYLKAHAGPEFVAFWGARWAPRGASNDPTDLNKNWPVNVTRFWLP
jgi:cephalosporin-C deacetylase-like acetyl esterase